MEVMVSKCRSPDGRGGRPRGPPRSQNVLSRAPRQRKSRHYSACRVELMGVYGPPIGWSRDRRPDGLLRAGCVLTLIGPWVLPGASPLRSEASDAVTTIGGISGSNRAGPCPPPALSRIRTLGRRAPRLDIARRECGCGHTLPVVVPRTKIADADATCAELASVFRWTTLTRAVDDEERRAPVPSG